MSKEIPDHHTEQVAKDEVSGENNDASEEKLEEEITRLVLDQAGVVRGPLIKGSEGPKIKTKNRGL